MDKMPTSPSPLLQLVGAPPRRLWRLFGSAFPGDCGYPRRHPPVYRPTPAPGRRGRLNQHICVTHTRQRVKLNNRPLQNSYPRIKTVVLHH
eukprot:3461193-Pyramimonas_sp.AAC.1